jgi:Cache domain
MPHRLHGINYRVLTTLLLVGLPVLIFGSYFVIERGRAQLRDAVGVTLSQRAEQSAAAIDTFVYRRIVDVSLLARVPDVRATAARSPKRPVNAAEMAEIDRRFAAIDLKAPVVAEVLGNTASRYFTDITRQDPIYRELLLTDRDGRLVAASNLTSDYYQADEDWWTRVMSDAGQGEATVSDVRWDESARTYAMEIAVPVPGDDGRPVGVLKVVADIREMLASVAGIDLGAGGEAMVVRRNGSVVFSRGAVDPRARFFAASELQERLERPEQAEGPSRFSFKGDSANGVPQVVGVATCQLGATYPHLPWVVVAWEAESRALAPVTSIFGALMLVFAVTLLCVLGLAFWFSRSQMARPLETEMDLVPHPHIARVAEEETT